MNRLSEIERFHFDYASCLDDDKFGEWPKFFAPKCRYEILSRENVEQGLPAPLMSCYSHGMVIDRVSMLVKGTLTYRRMYLKHFISNTRILREDDESICSEANVMVIQSTLEGVSSLYAVGTYHDVLVTSDEGLKIRERRVILDSFGIDTMLAVPI